MTANAIWRFHCCCWAYSCNKEHDRGCDSLRELSFISWYKAMRWMIWAKNSVINNWRETKWPISFICIIRIENLCSKHKETVVQLQCCFKQVVIADHFQPWREILQEYVLYLLMSYTMCLFLIITASNQVKTKTKMEMCKTETKMKWKKSVWNGNWNENRKTFQMETKLKCN